jgi:hypothetical protein
MSRPSVLSEESKQQRIIWLRRQNRMPLRQRFEDVFGEHGPTLYKQLKDAMSVAGTIGETFQREARAILRACTNIPLQKGGSQRRCQYVRKCIAGLALPTNATDDNTNLADGFDEATQRSTMWLLGQIAKKSKSDVQTVWMAANPLIELYDNRWPGNDDRCSAAFAHILENALHARNPLRYLRVVLRNEKADARHRNRKRKT